MEERHFRKLVCNRTMASVTNSHVAFSARIIGTQSICPNSQQRSDWFIYSSSIYLGIILQILLMTLSYISSLFLSRHPLYGDIPRHDPVHRRRSSSVTSVRGARLMPHPFVCLSSSPSPICNDLLGSEV